MSRPRGTLYLIPNRIDENSCPEAFLPASALDRIGRLRRYIVEADRAAWRLLGRVLDKKAAAEVVMDRLDEHTPHSALEALLQPLEQGEDAGLISEAGMPCVADPGAALVALAHDRNIAVQALVGPSSIILALASSGLDGQRFCFLGYLPQDAASRRAELARLDRALRSDGMTRIFIETPYRNARLLEDCLSMLAPETRLCVAAALGSEHARIKSAPIALWRESLWDPGKVPAVFLVGMAPGTGLSRPRQAQRVLPLKRGSRDGAARPKSQGR